MVNIQRTPILHLQVHFCLQRNCRHKIVLTLENTIIPQTTSVTNLIMQFDEQLHWKLHINKLEILLCTQTKSPSKTQPLVIWKANINTLVHLYKVVILSCLDYGAVTYINCSKSLVRIHGTLRLACGAFHTTPSVSILVDTGEKPSGSHFQLFARKYFLKTKSRHYLPIMAMLQKEGPINQQKVTFTKRAHTILNAYNFPSYWPVLAQPSIQYSSMVVNKDNGGSPAAELFIHRIIETSPGHTVPLHRWIQKNRTGRLCSYQ